MTVVAPEQEESGHLCLPPSGRRPHGLGDDYSEVGIDFAGRGGATSGGTSGATAHGGMSPGPRYRDNLQNEGLEMSRAAIVFDQAENRLHTIRAVLVATLGS